MLRIFVGCFVVVMMVLCGVDMGRQRCDGGRRLLFLFGWEVAWWV